MRQLGRPAASSWCHLAALVLLLASLHQIEAQNEQQQQQQQQQLAPALAGQSAPTPQQPLTGPSEAQQSIFNLRNLFNSTGQRFGQFTDRKCLMCKFSVSLINYALKTSRGYDQVDRLANSFCNIAHLESPLVCSQVSRLFNHEITKVLTYGLVTPNQVCGLLSNNTCGHFHSPLDEWEIQLDASAQLLDKMRAQQHLNEVATTTATTTTTATKSKRLPSKGQAPFRVIQISDNHVDLNYAAGSLVRCAEPLCCQKSSTLLNGSRVLGRLLGQPEPMGQSEAGFWGSYGHCDIPMRTFEAALKFISGLVAKSKDIDYIIWTGDIQPHDVWAQGKKSATRIYDAVFAQLQKHLPNIKILPTLGNHEAIPVDSFSPSNLIDIARDDSPVWLYRKLNSFWSRWLPQDTVKTILKDGFYATTIREGLKVVSLNTNFCHSKNFWLFINSTDPGNQLQWLVHELQMSELMHEKVHIIGHIPPGADDCMKVWSKNYNRILRRYQNTITAQFFGHTHNNEFELFYERQSRAELDATESPESNKVAASSAKESIQKLQQQQQHRQQVLATLATLNSTLSSTRNLTQAIMATAERNANTAGAANAPALKPFEVGFIGPSLTTFIGLNPSFRIYNIDPSQGFAPTDFETYYMNLTKANLNTTQEPQWTSAGLFTKTFGLNDTSASSIHELLVDLASELNLDAEGDAEDETSGATADQPETATSRTQGDEGGQAEAEEEEEEQGDEEMDGDEKLFQLYRLFNSYSDEFDRSVYERIAVEDKRKFLCRLMTGQAHDLAACREFIPTLPVLSLASGNITI